MSVSVWRRYAVPTSSPGRVLSVAEVGASRNCPRSAPAVVLVSGLGGAWFDWIGVARYLEDRCHVLVVDRPGTGDATADLETYASDLGVVLDSAHLEHAVLVGHSMGAWYVEAYARQHPERVSALVLVDGSDARVPTPGGVRSDTARSTTARSNTSPTDRLAWSTSLRLRAAESVFGMIDLVARRTVGWAWLGPTLRRLFEAHAPKYQAPEDRLARLDGIRRTYSRPSFWLTAAREWAAYPRLRAQLVSLRSARPLPNVPVVVVIATRLPERLSLWARTLRRQARNLAAVEPAARPRVIVLRPAPHMVMLTDPERLSTVIASILPSAIEQRPQ